MKMFYLMSIRPLWTKRIQYKLMQLLTLLLEANCDTD